MKQLSSIIKKSGRYATLQFFSSLSLLCIVGLPLAAVVLFAIFPNLNILNFDVPFSNWRKYFSDSSLLNAIKNSLFLGVCVVICSTLISMPIAYMRSIIPKKVGVFIDILALTPFLIPPYIGAAAWIQLLQKNGFSEQLLGINLSEYLFSFWGLVFVMSLHLYPIIYFSISSAFNVTSRRYNDAAFTCGAGRLRTFYRIQLPLSLGALVSSSLIVFILTIEEFGTPEILGQRFQFNVIVTAIHEKFSDWPIDLPGASVLSLILFLIAFLFFSLHILILKKFNAQTEASVSETIIKLSYCEKFIYLSVIAIILTLSILMPLGAIIARSFMTTVSGGLQIDNFSLVNYIEIFSSGSDAWKALTTSIGLAICASFICVFIATVTCFIIVRVKNKFTIFIDFLSLLPSAIPGMALAVGLILVWNHPFWPVTPYNSLAILLLAYSCLMLPYPIRMIASTLRQLPSSLDDAAYVSGANETIVIFKVLLPIITPVAIASGLIVFAISSRELVTSIMLAPAGIETVATFVFNQFDQGSINVGMAMSVITIFVTGILIIIARNLAYTRQFNNH